ncbi:MAG TPA: adenosylcobinamide-GDP ribazoletransferase [Puia sp.]|nr:adenosylcobinamide-GDP ribazoletransferase [Puia sp.]
MSEISKPDQKAGFRNELQIFFTAVMFLTRIPVPKNVDHSPEYLEKSPKYFPLVGWIVAGLSVLAFLIFVRYTSSDIAIIASMIAGLLTTGAFHEDGFADVCDAFGGGWTKEKILQIMKDSRIGAYGAMGIWVVLTAKFFLLKELPQYTPDLAHPTTNIFYNYRFFIAVIFAAHSLSRLMPVWVIQFSTYVTNPDVGKSKALTTKKLSLTSFMLANIFGLFPFIWLSWEFLFALIPVGYITYELTRYFQKWIGGYTGDCLGAIQQVSELIFYLSVLIIWRFAA